MALPLCPVCQNSYDLVRTPRSIHPCGHGICDSCYDQYVSRGGDTCPICRVHIKSTSVNYDLREMCKPPEIAWKRDLMRLVGRWMPGKDIIISDRFEVVAPLIVLRCEWTIGSFKRARRVLVDMISALPLKDVLQWVTALNFEPSVEAELLQHVSTLIPHKTLLGEDDWILQLTHSI